MANAGFILMNGRRGTTRAPRQNLTAKEYLAERMAAKPEAAAIERAKLMTREERLRSQDMGRDFRVAADNRDLNYDKFVVKGEVHTMADEAYTSHNTTRLDVEGTVRKLLTTDYVQNELKGIPNV